MRRLFSHDPLSGVRKYFRYHEGERESEDTFTIETEFDVEPLIEANKRDFNSLTSLDRWGDGRHVARIPMPLWAQLREKRITEDEPAFKRWLNDPDNRFFRTSPGRV